MRITFIISYLSFTYQLLLQKDTFYPGQSQYVYSQNDLIFESDEGDIGKLVSIGYDLIEKAFTMENFGSGEIIQIIIMQSIDFLTQNAYCVCQLLRNNQSQIIICKDGITISENKKKINVLHIAKNYTIQVDQNLGKCNELQSDVKNQLLCFCYSQDSLGILTINLRKQVHYIQKLNFELDILDCQKKIFDKNLDIIVAFYNCQNWMLIERKNNELNILLDRDTLNMLNYSDEISRLMDIVICQSYIYLIEPYFYLQLNIDNNNNISQIKRTNSTQIVKLILGQKCQVNTLIIQKENTNKIEFNRENKEITINISSYDQLANTDSYLILRKQGVVLLILSSFFNQTHQVESTNLMVQQQSPKRSLINKEIQNLMYQISLQKKEIQFYYFLSYFSIIKPTKRYFYSFANFNYFFNIEEDYILQSKNYQFSFQQNKLQKEIYLQADFDCENIQQIITDKDQFIFPNMIQSDIIAQNEEFSIIYDESYENYCKFKLNEFPVQLIWKYHSQFWQTTIIIFLVNENMQFYNCDNSAIIQSYHIGQRQLLSFKQYVFLAQLGEKKFTLINTSLWIISETIFDLESKIKYLKQFQEQIFIQLENFNCYIYDLSSSTFNQLKEDFLQYNTPIFIYVTIYIRIIQIKNFLLIQQKDEPAQYFFEDFGQIFRVDFSHIFIRIRSVYMNEKKIQTFIYSKQMIQKDQMYVINNQFDLISPLVMSDSLQYLAIAAKQNNSSCILLIRVNNVISMRQIMISPKLLFKQIVGQLIYLSQQNNFRVFYLETLILQFNTPQPFIQQYFATKNYPFSIFYYQGENPQTLKGNLSVLIKNACYNIFSLKENMIINSISKQQLKISDMFYGPIDSINSSSQDILKVIGPISQSTTLKVCKQIDELICLKQFTTHQKAQYQVQCSCVFQLNKIVFCLNANSKIYSSYLQIEKEDYIVEIIGDDNQNHYLFLLFIDLSQNILIERQKIQLKNFELPLNEFNVVQFKLLNNLLHFTHKYASSPNYHFYLLQPNNYKYYFLDYRIFSIIQIEQYDNQYLVGCQIVGGQMEIEFKIIIFSNDMIIANQIKTNVRFDNFLTTSNYIDEGIYKIRENLFWKKILGCQRFLNYLNISLIGMTDHLTFQVLLQIDLSGQSQNVSLIQLLRNPQSFERSYYYYINHFDANLAILSDFENQFYYFNLKEKLPMIDHMKEYKNVDYKFQQFNNTHYFYYLKESTEVFFGEIDYQIQFVQEVENQNYTLIASNNVSSTKVRIQYLEQKTDKFKTIFSQILIFVLFFFFILIIIGFCLRRQNHLNSKKMEIIKQYNI